MMLSKRILAALFAALLTFGAVACVEGEGEGEEGIGIEGEVEGGEGEGEEGDD